MTITNAQSSDLKGQLLINESMSKHTTWRVGGSAERFYQPNDLDDLTNFIQSLPGDESIYWVGLGSNLLVRDGGIKGTVICLAGFLDDYEFINETTIRVQAGLACAKVARITAKNGLCGAEFLAGIPGTMGGALAMNAGAFGGETWDIVVQVETLNRQGLIQSRTSQDVKVGYREVKVPDGEWFVAATLRLGYDPEQNGLERIKTLLNRRAETQPMGLPSCGSVFRNPPGDYAARLIEACGLKGYRYGDAEVSEKHANFIINRGAAKASEIECLIQYIQHQVVERFAINLISEVKILGEFE